MHIGVVRKNGWNFQKYRDLIGSWLLTVCGTYLMMADIGDGRLHIYNRIVKQPFNDKIYNYLIATN